MIRSRIQSLDMARGAAIFLMAGFHLCYNLEYFQVVDFNIKENPFWTSLRNVIVSMFVFIAGVSLSLSGQKRSGFADHVRKQKWLALCALLVSLATYPLFPGSWIYFGVLHFILAARILGYALTGYFKLNLVLGVFIIWAGLSFESGLFNPKWINWLGFVSQKPFTEDYVPLFPWMGVFLLGMFAKRIIYGGPQNIKAGAELYSGATSRVLVLAGRNSLAIYMLHQPLLMGLMYLVLLVAGRI